MTTNHLVASCEVVVVEGLDATGLIESQLSQAVSGLEVGGSCWSLLLEPDGHLGDWLRVVRLAEDQWLFLGARGRATAIAERLGRFKLREKATIATEVRSVMVLPEADAMGMTALPPLWSGSGEVEVLGEAGEDVTDRSGFVELERRRIDSGRLGPDDLVPGDNPFCIGGASLAEAVSFTKGCYTGQELVARIDARSGSAPRRLVLAESRSTVSAGSPLVFDGREVGDVRSSGGDARSICMVARAVPVPSRDEVSVDGVPLVLCEPTESR